MGYRTPLAAHVSQDDGVWPKRHCDGGHQRGGYCAVGFARKIREAAGVSSAGWPNQAKNSRLREQALFNAAQRTRIRVHKIQKARLQGHEAALRMGTDGWPGGTA